MDIKSAKRKLLIVIDIVSEFWNEDEMEAEMQNAMGYYNNCEEDMAYRNMTPREYLRYASEEIGYFGKNCEADSEHGGNTSGI